MWRSVGFIAKHQGVTRQTANRWIHEGKYDKVQKTEGGHHRVWLPADVTCTFGYCRVSSAKQKSSLVTQEQIIRRSYPGVEVLSDIGGGFNFDRKGLRALLERSLSGAAVTVVVTTRDRLARSGFPIIQWLVELYGGKVIVLEDAHKPEEFDAATLVSFVTSFIASYHGKRSARRKKDQAAAQG